MKLYENIKQLRIENGWTQQELADRTGYTDRSSITKIEKGLVDLTQKKIQQFADVFGVNPAELMGIDDTAEDTKAEISRLFDYLTPDQQQAVLQFLRTMISNR